MSLRFTQRRPLIEQFNELDIEPDQKLRRAIESLPKVDGVGDHTLFIELLRQNSLATRLLDFDRLTRTASTILSARPRAAAAMPSLLLTDVLHAALANREDERVLGTIDMFRAWFAGTEAPYNHRPWTIDLLSQAYTGRLDCAYEELEPVWTVLERLERVHRSTEDYAFILASEEDRVVFRVASTLDDYPLERGDGFLPARAVLTHAKDHFGGFTPTEIFALEELLNHHCKESELQRFFETHPHFLRRWDFREIYPQTYLRRDGDGPLVPDFILTDRELQRAAILELKLPSPTLVVREHNRERFSASIMEARAQLLTYRDWFRESRNRRSLKDVVGMEIFEPRLMVVIGRSSDFVDELDRQQLASRMSDVEVVTYDDILTHAYRRLLFVGNSGTSA